jgi:hypothetical protein
MAASINDWKCVVCFAIVGNKIRYKKVELDNKDFSTVLFSINGHLNGKFICVKCLKCLNEMITLRKEMEVLNSTLALTTEKLDSVRNKLQTVRLSNESGIRERPILAAIVPRVQHEPTTCCTSNVKTPVKGGKRLHFDSPGSKKIDCKATPVKENMPPATVSTDCSAYEVSLAY